MNTGTTCAALPPPIRTHVSHTVDTVDTVDIVDIVDTQIPDLESQFTNNMTLTIYHHSHYLSQLSLLCYICIDRFTLYLHLMFQASAAGVVVSHTLLSRQTAGHRVINYQQSHSVKI